MTVLAAAAWPDNSELILDLVELGYLGLRKRTLDPTYGKGIWWKQWRPLSLTTHDIKADGVDFRKLPEADGAFEVVAYDPPYVAIGGRKTSTLDEFNDSYGLDDAPKTPALLQEMINDGILEMWRVLEHRGILLVKVCDYVSSGKVWWGTDKTDQFCQANGFRKIDRFDMIGSVRAQPERYRACKPCKGDECKRCSGTRQVPSRQQHARRNVSTLFVYTKVKR